jgi:hypothetical protein
MPVRVPAVMIGMAMAPNATGAVLATSTTTAARIAVKPTATSMTPVIATGCAEAGERLQEAAEAEGDDDRLDARIIGDDIDDQPQVLEMARAHSELIEPDRGDDDPHDGEQAEGEALRRRQPSQSDRHSVWPRSTLSWR